MTTLTGEGYRPAELEQTPETFDEALATAREEFYSIPFEKEFEQMCADPRRKVDLSDDNTTASPRYLAAVSDYMHRKADEQRELTDVMGERLVPERVLVVKELVAATGDYIATQAQLERLRDMEHSGQLSRDDPRHATIRGAIKVASYYNGLIRSAAEEFPDLTPKKLMDTLGQIANVSLEHAALKHMAPNIIRSTVRGAQIELGHDQLLYAAGVSYRTTTVDEDVFKGGDYLAWRDDGSQIYVNSKSSPTSLRHMGIHNRNYGYDRRGVLHVAMLSDDEMGDSFIVPQVVADRRAAEMHVAVNSHPHRHRHRHPAYSSASR